MKGATSSERIILNDEEDLERYMKQIQPKSGRDFDYSKNGDTPTRKRRRTINNESSEIPLKEERPSLTVEENQVEVK